MKRMRFLWVRALGVLFLLIPHTTDAGWIKTFGGDRADEGNYVLQKDDGNYIVAGSSSSYGGGSNIWIFEVIETGEQEWMRLHREGPNCSWKAKCLQKTDDGGYIIGGNGVAWLQPYPVLVKTYPDGSEKWTSKPGPSSSAANYVQQLAGGDYIVAYSWGLMKIDSSGNPLWGKECYAYDGIESCCITLAEDGGYLFSGKATSNKGLCVVKTDQEGDTIWTRTYGEGRGYRIQQTKDGNYIVLGEIGPRLLKINPDGNVLWDKAYDDIGIGRSVQPTSDGGYIVSGYTDWEGELFLLRTNPDGAVLWIKYYKEGYGSRGWCVKQTSDGGYIVTGCMYPRENAEQTDLLLIKTDSLGCVAVEEEPMQPVSVGWEVVTSIGPQIILRYADRPDAFHALIFDASGRKVDEVHSTQASGALFWGEGQMSGVYFIKVSGEPVTQKVVITR